MFAFLPQGPDTTRFTRRALARPASTRVRLLRLVGEGARVGAHTTQQPTGTPLSVSGCNEFPDDAHFEAGSAADCAAVTTALHCGVEEIGLVVRTMIVAARANGRSGSATWATFEELVVGDEYDQGEALFGEEEEEGQEPTISAEDLHPIVSKRGGMEGPGPLPTSPLPLTTSLPRHNRFPPQAR